jgi:hypothetical protein
MVKADADHLLGNSVGKPPQLDGEDSDQDARRIIAGGLRRMTTTVPSPAMEMAASQRPLRSTSLETLCRDPW